MNDVATFFAKSYSKKVAAYTPFGKEHVQITICSPKETVLANSSPAHPNSHF
jgi:hypothetical protein